MGRRRPHGITRSCLTSGHSRPTFQGLSQANPDPIEPVAARVFSRQEAEREDRVFWHSRTPGERLVAAEQLLL